MSKTCKRTYIFRTNWTDVYQGGISRDIWWCSSSTIPVHISKLTDSQNINYTTSKVQKCCSKGITMHCYMMVDMVTPCLAPGWDVSFLLLSFQWCLDPTQKWPYASINAIGKQIFHRVWMKGENLSTAKSEPKRFPREAAVKGLFPPLHFS